MHDSIGEVDSFQSDLARLIPESEQNILLAAVRRFCPQEGLHELLVKPYANKTTKLKESAAFELHVSWLLSLFGFAPIVLGEYERLVDPTTKVQRSSVDLIARRMDHNLLLVVACALAAPKEGDFLNLMHATEILRREVFSESSVVLLGHLYRRGGYAFALGNRRWFRLNTYR